MEVGLLHLALQCSHRIYRKIRRNPPGAPIPTFYVLIPLILTPLSPHNTQAPDFSVDAEAALERRMQEAHLHNAAQLAQQAERRRMEESLPRDLRDFL